MTQVTLDEQTIAKLEQLPGTAQLCDARGRIVGTFEPVNRDTVEPLGCPFTDDELDRFEQEPGARRSLSEVMNNLQKLA